MPADSEKWAEKKREKAYGGVGGNGGYLNPRIPLSNTNMYVKVYI